MPTSESRNSKLLAAVASVSVLAFAASEIQAQTWSVYDKTIPQLITAYQTSQTTVADVVNQYVTRINSYNKNGGGDGTLGTGGRGINAIAEINPNLATEVAAAQALIAGGATTAQYPLLGVPVIVKDSYDAVGMATANGVSVLRGASTPGATTLMPTTDAFSVARLRASGAVILGKATQTTMAYATNGLSNSNGVVVNPYNPNRTVGGSSSGVGAGIASQFAMLGMGGETGGSIRIPSNGNALVGIKPSIGLIDPGGTWCLTPARDVVGPMAKSVTDIAYALNALVAPSATNLHNDNPAYAGAAPGTVRPANYTSGLSTTALQGKVLAVPKSMYQTTTANGNAYEGIIAPTVKTAFDTAIAKMKSEGATIIYVDIPASTKYYNTIGKSSGATTTGFGYDYPTTTVGGTTPSSTWSAWTSAYYYEKQIESYNDPKIKNLRDFANALAAGSNGLAGSPFSTLNGAANNIAASAAIWEAGNAKGFDTNPDAIRALKAFSDLRIAEMEGFMSSPNLVDDPSTPDVDESTITKIDSFVAPTFGSVMGLVAQNLRQPGAPTTDPYSVSGQGALQGRFENNILGTPAVSVPMGYAPDGTPMGIQFFAELLSEPKLLGLAYDYEQATQWRVSPDLTFVPEPGMGTIAVIAGAALLKRRRRNAAATVNA